MRNLSKFLGSIILLCLLSTGCQAASTATEAVASTSSPVTASTSTSNKSSSERPDKLEDEAPLVYPFLLLLSNEQVSVAHLPLIDDGKISIAYLLPGPSGLEQEGEPTGRSNEEASWFISSETASAATSPAGGGREPAVDAREFEQMPREQSLRKFAQRQQQIAGRSLLWPDEAHGSAEAEWAGPQPAARQGTEPKKSAQEQAKRPGSGKEQLTGNDNSNGRNANAVMESSPLASDQGNVDVTSAAGGHGSAASGSGVTAVPGPEVATDKAGAGGSTSASGSSIQFTDLDVHMALGYVFVADSTGRIHRFKLNVFRDKSGAHANESFMENDYANSIRAAYVGGPSRVSDLSFVSISANEGGSTDKTGAVSSGDEPGDVYDDDNANKLSSALADEQSGQHPMTVSGIEARRVPEFGTATPEQAAANNHSDSPKRATASQQGQFDAASKIIWSRIKHGLSSVSGAATGAKPPNRPIPHLPIGQARGAAPGNQTGAANQMDSGTISAGQIAYNDSQQAMVGGQSQKDGQPMKVEIEQAASLHSQSRPDNCAADAQLLTQIAVDWMNNILFVLDKCRLILVDFDGNNELVLIDDFDVNNRPVDLKVDPTNDFLFWLQVGTFENTIYRLDLNSIAERLMANSFSLSSTTSANGRAMGNPQSASSGASTELMALTSRNYAHPIIFDLPQHAKIFTIDHKHSRIYVPLAPIAIHNGSVQHNKIHRDNAVVFGPILDSNTITHLNNTVSNIADSTLAEADNTDCNKTESSNAPAQIRAYKFDGTDRGPIRGLDGKIQASELEDMQDITLDSEKGLLYWLTNSGHDLFEELAIDPLQTAQHSLEGKKYHRLIHFAPGTNQPKSLKTKFNIKRLIHVISSTNTVYRWIRNPSNLDQIEGIASKLNGRNQINSESINSSRAPIILGFTLLLVAGAYLVYTFIFQRFERSSSQRGQNEGGSIEGSSSMGDSNIDCELNQERFSTSNTISRWMSKPMGRNADASTSLNRDHSGREVNDLYDIESTNYNESNAIDEHYQDMVENRTIYDLDTSRLANLSGWPINLHDVSNKLYVPVEVLQDEALSSINRISIDQLEIERTTPLGEGHFGTVLQGVITCTVSERTINKPQIITSNYETCMEHPSLIPSLDAIRSHETQVPSSSSSGHGSSSLSSEFITANSCVDTTNGDYLTPKSNYPSTMSDYQGDNLAASRPDSYISFNQNLDGKLIQTRLKVAIKKLKDNASPEEKRDFLQEAKLLANFEHPNIVQLIGICLDRGSTLIVMELMLGGDLIRYMQENRPRLSCPENLTQADLITICLDIVKGCCYLEDRNYIHRDLAARNCLVSSVKRDERVVKLADFGLARDIYKDSYYKKLNDSAMPLKWMAPECLIEQKFTIMSDVWSFGVVMWEVMSFCQEKPYVGVEPFFMKEHLTSGARLRKPEDCIDDIYKLMNECWQLDPKLRPTFQECRLTLIEIKDGIR